MRVGILAFLAVLGGAAPLLAERFTSFQEMPLCGDGFPLELEEQFALGFTDGDYIAHFREDGVPKEMRFTVDTPGAGQGDDFPADICGSHFLLSIDGGAEVRGVLEYYPPQPNEEHQPYNYQVKLEGEPVRQLMFSRTFDTVWGILVDSSVEGRDGVSFFTGANVYRWE